MRKLEFSHRIEELVALRCEYEQGVQVEKWDMYEGEIFFLDDVLRYEIKTKDGEYFYVRVWWNDDKRDPVIVSLECRSRLVYVETELWVKVQRYLEQYRDRINEVLDEEYGECCDG